jgi:excisionase family DNA binding protein
MTAPHEQVGDTLPKLYTIKHAAERWDLSQKTLRRLIESGELGAYQLERPRNGKRGSLMRIAETELLALLDRMRV